MLRYAEDRQWLLADRGRKLVDGYLRASPARMDRAALELVLQHP